MLEFIIEFILELVVDGSLEVSKNKKISKWVRYPIILFLIIFFGIVIVGLIYLGIIFIHDSILVGILFIGLGIFFFVGSIIKFKKIYLKNVEE